MKKLTILILSVFLIQFCAKKNENSIIVQGIVDADIITMKPIASGKVEKIFFNIGDSVTKDAILLKINSDKIENKLNEIEIALKEIKVNREKLLLRKKTLKEKLSYLKKQYERLRRLNLKKAVSGEKLERAKLSLDEAISSDKEIEKSLTLLTLNEKKLINQREYLNIELRNFFIKSPVTGEILDKFVSEGENVFPGTPVFDIYDRNSIYIEVFLEEGEIGNLKVNQNVKITIDGVKKNLKGKIFYFGKKAEFSPKYIISEKERKELLYLVKIKPTNHIELYKIGMPVTVEIEK